MTKDGQINWKKVDKILKLIAKLNAGEKTSVLRNWNEDLKQSLENK